MNRSIYCDDNISIWKDSSDKSYFYVVNNKTRQLLFEIEGEEVIPDFILPIDIQAAFNLYDKDGNVEHIMPKED